MARSKVVDDLSLDLLMELLGMEKVVEKLGPERVFQELQQNKRFKKNILAFFRNLTPQQREEWKRMIEEE